MSGLAEAKPDTAGHDVVRSAADAGGHGSDPRLRADGHTRKNRRERETRFAGARTARLADCLPVLPIHEHCSRKRQGRRFDLLALPGLR